MSSGDTFEQLRQALKELDKTVRATSDTNQSFRKYNQTFDAKDEVVRLLLAACEKLAVEKEVRDRASFEEHTSELTYLCKYFRTAIDSGVTDRDYQEKRASMPLPEGARRRSSTGRQSFALCCSQEFPPQHQWWTSLSEQLTHQFQVIRGGKNVTASAFELVTGDILFLSAGKRAPVDARVLVLAPRTKADVSQAGVEDEAWELSTEPTADTPSGSHNILLKDSFLVSGAAFCMVVRPMNNPILPSGNARARVDDEEPFRVDTTVPEGMTSSQCKTAFKQLAMKSRLACRSFKAVLQLGRASSLVVLLTQELAQRDALVGLANAAKRSGKALILVSCDCEPSSIKQLSQELGLPSIDISKSNLNGEDSHPAKGLPPRSPSSLHAEHLASLHSSMPSSPTASASTRYITAPLETERHQLSLLTVDVAKGSSPGAIISGVSSRGVYALCSNLADRGMPAVYVVGSFHFPECLKSLLRMNPPARPGSVVHKTSLAMAPRPTARHDVVSSTPSEHSVNGNVNNTHNILRAGSTLSQDGPEETGPSGILSHIITDPAMQLAPPPPPARGSSKNLATVELIISVNYLGVLSEHADCVLLKSDLGALGQALEIAAKSVPKELRNPGASERA